MKEASVKILATCPDGHEIQMFPENCVNMRYLSNSEYDPLADPVETIVEWECHRCTGKKDIQNSVRICLW